MGHMTPFSNLHFHTLVSLWGGSPCHSVVEIDRGINSICIICMFKSWISEWFIWGYSIWRKLKKTQLAAGHSLLRSDPIEVKLSKLPMWRNDEAPIISRRSTVTFGIILSCVFVSALINSQLWIENSHQLHSWLMFSSYSQPFSKDLSPSIIFSKTSGVAKSQTNWKPHIASFLSN